jgi:hypothetical protein
MKRFIGFMTASLLVAGGVSAAQAADGAEGAKPKKERKVCRVYAKTTSRIGSDRVCKTQAEWDADALNDAIAMEKFKTENTGRPLVSGPGSQPTRRN